MLGSVCCICWVARSTLPVCSLWWRTLRRCCSVCSTPCSGLGWTPRMQNMLQENPWTLLLQQPPTVVGVIDGERREFEKHRVSCVRRAVYILSGRLLRTGHGQEVSMWPSGHVVPSSGALDKRRRENACQASLSAGGRAGRARLLRGSCTGL